MSGFFVVLDKGLAYLFTYLKMVGPDCRAEPCHHVRMPRRPISDTVRSITPSAIPRQPA